MRDLIATAREWKLPPLKLAGVGGDEWTDTDRLLALAYHAYEQGLCSCCGYPIRLAHDDRMDGWYEPKETICQACAAREHWNRDHKGKDSEPGLLLGIQDTRSDEDKRGGKIPR